MALDPYEIGYFITQVGLSAASFGVAQSDITDVASALFSLFSYKCEPPSESRHRQFLFDRHHDVDLDVELDVNLNVYFLSHTDRQSIYEDRDIHEDRHSNQEALSDSCLV
ncbi:hypothetical protein LTR01_008949 [Friedmanniomyces endolithicus]|nr:hypothetical protein LTS09_017788 [Friedmanniomyces endolithicus]KAK0302119.1 hypothetical protein LTR01_008949 [Friedmanniomyces endolithicus]